MPQSSYHINMKYKQNVFIAMFKMTTVKKTLLTAMLGFGDQKTHYRVVKEAHSLMLFDTE